MVLCINAGAKVILFIGSTILFTNLLSRNVMIFNKFGVLLLAFPVSFLSFIPRSPRFFTLFSSPLYSGSALLFGWPLVVVLLLAARKKFFCFSPFYYLCTVFNNKLFYVQIIIQQACEPALYAFLS